MLTQNQKGRSMIEMLGVLAIIGVLSIGGIAGYSKAMSKYRVNKTIDQVSQLAQNIRTLYANQKNYGTLSDSVIRKAHLAPEEMYETSGSDTLTNPFGGNVYVHPHGKNNIDDHKAFSIGIQDIPQDACVELATRDWGIGSSSGLIAIAVGGGTVASVEGIYYGCTSGSNYVCADNGVMPVDKAVSLCSRSTTNAIGIKFY